MSKSLSSNKRVHLRLAALAFLLSAIALSPATTVADTDAAAGDATKKPARKIRENSYYYSAFNRRDPFASLISGEFISEKKMDPVQLGRVHLVGIVKGELDRFALLEDDKGFSYILRVGDRVVNGRVVAIGEETMVARVTNFGQTRKFTLRMARRSEGDKR